MAYGHTATSKIKLAQERLQSTKVNYLFIYFYFYFCIAWWQKPSPSDLQVCTKTNGIPSPWCLSQYLETAT